VSATSRVIRTPSHLGDLVMALPALAVAGRADLVVPRWLAPLLSLAAPSAALIPFDRGASGLAVLVRRLRAGAYAEGVLLAPSFSAALAMRLGGVRRRRGLDTDGRRGLLTDPLPRGLVAGRHRSALYWRLVTGADPDAVPTPRIELPVALRARGAALVRAGAAPVVGLFPGGNAPARRWDADRFAALARQLSVAGHHVVVFGGPAETELTRAVAAGGGVDLGGRTDLPLLAAALASCDILVANDSGPMHVAAAVGTRTIGLLGAADAAETGVSGPHVRMLQRTDLPCVPCVKNVCPRRGRGTLLPDAERECLRLIGTSDVLSVIGRLAPATETR
jgi:heptosyltransferase-2